MTPADTQAALAAATATLESPGDPLAWLHARDVLALVACVSALRDVLAQTERERDEARRTLRFIDRIADATMRLAETTRFSRARDHDAAYEAHGIYADYGGMLRERRHDATRGVADTAEGAGVTEDELVAVEWRRRPPFNDATTRRLCAFLGCDPGPLLDAAAKCEEAMRNE